MTETLKELDKSEDLKQPNIDNVKPLDVAQILDDSDIDIPDENELYSSEEYIIIKKNIINSLNSSFGKGSFDAKEFNENSFDKFPPSIAEKLIWDFYTSDKGKSVDVDKFMKTFNSYNSEYNSGVTTDDGINKTLSNFEHGIGTLSPKTKENQDLINNIILKFLNQGKFKLTISGSADGSEVTKEGKQKLAGEENKNGVYVETRNLLFDGCNDQAKTNLNKLFPEFNNQNFPNKDSYNRGYALWRIMNEISFLSPDIKNKLFSGPYSVLSSQQNESGKIDIIKIGDSTFKVVISNSKGKEYTFSKTDIISTESYIKNYEDMINQLDNTKIVFRTDFKGNKNTSGKKYMGGYVGVMLRDGSLLRDVSASTKEKWESDYAWGPQDSNGNVSIDKNQSNMGTKNITIKLTEDMMKNPKYSKFFDEEAMKQGNYKFKQIPTFTESLQMIKDLSGNNTEISDFSNEQLLCRKNYKLLNEKIAADPELRSDLANHIVEKRYPNLPIEEKVKKIMEIRNNIGKAIDL